MDDLRQFLHEVEIHAGLEGSGYATHGHDRFVAASAEYGDTWQTRPALDLVAEAWEEAVDGGTWLGLFALRQPDMRLEALALAAEQARLAERLKHLHTRARFNA